MRGYFGIGVERLSKPMNAGNLFRSAHAFGASFVFTINAPYAPRRARSDTSRAPEHLPLYVFDRIEALLLPKGCALVGVELVDQATALPSFRHPRRAAYVLGPERGALSPALVERCDHLVRIPARFSVNLAVAGAIVMYDRLLALGRWPQRPVTSLAEPEPLTPHVRGAPVVRRWGEPEADAAADEGEVRAADVAAGEGEARAAPGSASEAAAKSRQGRAGGRSG